MQKAYETYAVAARLNRNQLTALPPYKTYMASPTDRDPEIVARGDRLRRARLAAGYDQPVDAIKACGLNENSYYLHENGRATFSFKYAQQRYAPAFGVSPSWLYSGKGSMLSDAPAPSVPIIGLVSAGFEGDFSDDYAMGAADDWLEPEAVEGRIALRIDGNSMVPLAHHGDIAVFGPRQDDPRSLYGHRVMARLKDERKLFKVLRPGSVDGLYTLFSLNSAYDPIEDVELEWVLPLERLHIRTKSK